MGAIAKSDIELVEASLRGEHEAFGHLVARYQDVVCAVSYSSTGDRVLSEDVAQETFIAAWRQLDRLRASDRLRPWLCGIARNLARTARKRRRREDLVDAVEHDAAGASPFDAAARGDVERVVRAALARIPDAYREVLVLYYSEDQSIRAVAETLGVTETTVMQRLSRGRRYLADHLTDVVERSLRSERRRRDLVASVVAAIAVIAMPSRVDASPMKGSTMLKSAIAASALVAAGTTAYLVHSHRAAPTPRAATTPPTLRYGGGPLGLARAPSLGPSAAPRALPSRSAAEADLALLPADADTVIGVNVAQLRESALWKRFVAPVVARASGIREFEALCGFDPLASLSSVSIGLKGFGSDDDAAVSGVVVVHGFERTKAMTCFDTQGVAEAEKEGSKVTIDDGVVLISDPAGDPHVAFTFLDATTALIVLGPEATTKEGVARIAAGNDGVLASTAFATTLQAINTDDSLWLMVADTSPLVRAINAAAAPHTPIQLGTLYVSLNVSELLALDAGVRLGSPETVAQLVTAIETQMNARDPSRKVSGYFDQLDVMADGSDLIVSLAISGDQILRLLAALATSGEISFTL